MIIPALNISIQYCPEVIPIRIEENKEIRTVKNWKGRDYSLLDDIIIIYLDNMWTIRANMNANIVRYESKIPKSMVFFYNNNC